jgi:S1-C subfamily serine protease
VAEVENAGWADVAGLQVNDLVTAVQGQAISGLESFRRVQERVRQERPDRVVFFVRRGARTRFVPVRTDW